MEDQDKWEIWGKEWEATDKDKVNLVEWGKVKEVAWGKAKVEGKWAEWGKDKVKV